MANDPYLVPNRLQDVLAAIQFFAANPDYDLTLEEFRKRVAADPRSAADWSGVLEGHPEFFRRSEHGAHYSLVLRRAKPKNNAGQRPPLTSEEVSTLIESAISLQKQALELQRERRAWLPLLASFSGAVAGFAGSVIGAAIGAGKL